VLDDDNTREITWEQFVRHIMDWTDTPADDPGASPVVTGPPSATRPKGSRVSFATPADDNLAASLSGAPPRAIPGHGLLPAHSGPPATPIGMQVLVPSAQPTARLSGALLTREALEVHQERMSSAQTSATESLDASGTTLSATALDAPSTPSLPARKSVRRTSALGRTPTHRIAGALLKKGTSGRWDPLHFETSSHYILYRRSKGSTEVLGGVDIAGVNSSIERCALKPRLRIGAPARATACTPAKNCLARVQRSAAQTSLTSSQRDRPPPCLHPCSRGPLFAHVRSQLRDSCYTNRRVHRPRRAF
jgi:hypothetical protein